MSYRGLENFTLAMGRSKPNAIVMRGLTYKNPEGYADPTCSLHCAM